MSKTSFFKKVSYGVIGSLTDFLLWYVFLVGASVGKKGSRGVYQAFYEADKALKELNHKTLASTWSTLIKKNFITIPKRKNLFHPEITQLGRKRLHQSYPHYLLIRPWDKKIYLITYDIPEKVHTKRDMLRSFLKQLKCKYFQESIWVTVYNPRELINEFIKENNIPGTIIVSDVGNDGGIGEITIEELIIQLYDLKKLNERYKEFIEKVNNEIKNSPYLLFEYLSILKDDPQLPFELLPKWWLGDKAYLISQGLMIPKRL